MNIIEAGIQAIENTGAEAKVYRVANMCVLVEISEGIQFLHFPYHNKKVSFLNPEWDKFISELLLNGPVGARVGRGSQFNVLIERWKRKHVIEHDIREIIIK